MLYHNGSTKLETKGYGIDITGGFITTGGSIVNDGGNIKFGNDSDLQIFHDNSNNINVIQCHNGRTLHIDKNNGAENMAKFIPDGAVELYHDNVKALSTSSTGINVWGRSGNGVLDIYPTGSAVYSILNLHNTAGGSAYNAQLIATSGQSVYLGSGNTGDVVLRTGNSQNKVVGRHNGATELYHSSNKKFETTSTGVDVTGNITMDAVPGANTNAIEYVTISSTGNGTDFGDLTTSVYNGSGCAQGTG